MGRHWSSQYGIQVYPNYTLLGCFLLRAQEKLNEACITRVTWFGPPPFSFFPFLVLRNVGHTSPRCDAPDLVYCEK
jgi:hypothetical protein